jgi:Nickel responsive protein SCO4226-like
MDLYVILRRNGWRTGQDLQEAAARSTAEGDKPDSGVRWIRSYVLSEESGEVGTVCIYEADSPESIRAHADAADLPVDEIDGPQPPARASCGARRFASCPQQSISVAPACSSARGRASSLKSATAVVTH